MNNRFVLAYDLGTSGAKCALVTLDGKLVSTATEGYPLHTAPQNRAEQEPEDYWGAVCRATGAVLAKSFTKPEAIAGMAFGTLWKGMIPIDDKGNVLHRSILWLDGRAGEQAKRLNARFGEGRYGPSDYWPKLLWLRENEPEIIDNATWILEVNAFLKWKATGKATVDISDSFVHSFDEKLDAYYEELFAFMDIPREKFPPFVNAWETVGILTQKASQELGLIPGIPVFGGNNDIQGVSVGAGCAAVGDVHVYFGSSGWMGFTVAHAEKFTTSPFDTRRDIFLAGMKSVGLSLHWVARNFYSEEYRRLDDGVFTLMDQEVSEIPAGSNGVIATSWLYGEYPPQADLNAGACFMNLRSDHTRGHMARAMMEAICFHLKQRAQYFCQRSGYSLPKVINAVGGGACSSVWMQMLADILNMPVHIPESPRHAGAVGTAYSAIVGLGLCADVTEASKTLRIERVFTPNPDAVAIYEKYFQVYTRLYETLKPVISELSDMR